MEGPFVGYTYTIHWSVPAGQIREEAGCISETTCHIATK